LAGKLFQNPLKDSKERPVALITGASSGIGREFVRIFAQSACDVVLVARDVNRLEEIAQQARALGVSATVIGKDLSLSTSAPEIFSCLQESGTEIDFLINNAGLGTHGPFASIPMEADLRLLQVNIVALTQLTKLFLPGMIQRRRGKVLNVASLAAFQPGPLMATYFASKAYVLSVSEALAYEVAGTGVTVTALCPGPVRTEFRKRAGSEGKRTLGRTMDPASVARAGYRGMMRGRRIVIPNIGGRLVAMLGRLAPRALLTWAAAKMNTIH
jgi:short-subunit dehydrogenase